MPSGLSPHPQHAGSWCGGIRSRPSRAPLTAGRSPTPPAPDPAGGAIRRSWRLSALACAVLRATRLYPAESEEPERALAGSAEPAALEMRLVEVLRARCRHRGRGGDLQRERGRRHDLREPVDLPGAITTHERKPRAGIGEGRTAADRRHLEPG